MLELTNINAKLQLSYVKITFPQNVFNIAVLNIIWAMVAAKRYDYDDPLIKELMMMVTDVTASLAPTPSLGFLGRHHNFPNINAVLQSRTHESWHFPGSFTIAKGNVG